MACGLSAQMYAAMQAAAGGIRGKLGLYIEVRDNMSEGLRFYMSLQEAIQALQQQAGDYILTRKLERYSRILQRSSHPLLADVL